MGTKYHGFRDLIVYEKSYSFGNDIFELSKSFPQNEQYSLTSQIRRSP
jgi:four helix bundle protein